jgi:hypothetical protein
MPSLAQDSGDPRNAGDGPGQPRPPAEAQSRRTSARDAIPVPPEGGNPLARYLMGSVSENVH